MRILVTWTGNSDPRRSWEWLLARYLARRGHEVAMVAPAEAAKGSPGDWDFIIATDAFTAVHAEALSYVFKAPFAVGCVGSLPAPEVDDGYWGEVREAMDKAAVIVAWSGSARDHMLLTYKPKPPVVVNWQGVDDETADRFKPAAYDEKGPFLWIGALEERKQPELAEWAFERAAQDRRVGPLTMIGGITEKYRDFGLSPCIRHLGPLSDEEKFKQLAQARCLVATTYGEEFFIPAAEAAYYNLPLILPKRGMKYVGDERVTPVPEHWVTVLQELWGDLPYWYEDRDALVAQILHVAHHPLRARNRGKELRRQLEAKGLTMSKHAERWENIIREAIERSTTRTTIATGIATGITTTVPIPTPGPSEQPPVKVVVEWANTGRLTEENFWNVTAKIHAIETELGLPHSGPQPRSLNWSRRFEYAWAILNANLHVNEQVLDAGAGDGSLQLFLARHCITENMDIDTRLMDNMRQLTQGKGFQLAFREASIEKMPYPDGAFDKVFCISVLEHMKPPHLGHVKELIRVVKPGGSLLITMDVVQEKNDYFQTGYREAEEICNWLGAKIPPEPPDILTSTKTEGRQFLDREIKVLCLAIRIPTPQEAVGGLRLNIGSYRTMHAKPWINLDILDMSDYAKKEGYEFQQADVTKGLPFPDQSAEYINASHLLEHLTLEEARRFVLECLRVLKPRGMIRIGCPDGRKMAQAYLEGKMDEVGTGQPEEFQKASTEAEKFWLLLTSGHKTVYDFTSLQRVLSRAGYAGIKDMPPGKSRIPGVEPELRDMYPEHTIYVEAVKPDREALETLRYAGYEVLLRPYRMDLAIAQEISAAGIYTKHQPAGGKVVVIDLGAHIGLYSLLAAHHSAAIIHAYEPQTENFLLLVKNIARNNLQERIHPHMLAVAGKAGPRKLFLDQGNNTGGHSINQKPVGSSEYITVECVTLPQVLDEVLGAEKPERCMVKIDVEGAEGEILLNTPPGYLDKIDAMIVEFHRYGQYKEVREYLERNGFVFEYCAGDKEQGGTCWFVKAGQVAPYKQYLLGMIPEGREAVK